jgi:hypothetical protein
MSLNALSLMRMSCLTSCVVGALFLAACTATENQAPGSTPSLLEKLFAGPTAGEKPAAANKKDSCGTALQCRAVLKAMINDPKRSWVGQQQAAVAYADGTRLFAYRGLRAKLSCSELVLAIDEIRATAKSFVEPVPGVAPDRASRTRALSRQVEGELVRERARRCKP